MKKQKKNYPEFYLTSTEVRPTLVPRICKIIEKLWSDERKTYFYRIHIDPSIKLNFNEEFDEIVIAPRHEGVELIPISKFPPVVYVCFIVNNAIKNTGHVQAKDLRIFIIGEIYLSLSDAESAIVNEIMRI